MLPVLVFRKRIRNSCLYSVIEPVRDSNVSVPCIAFYYAYTYSTTQNPRSPWSSPCAYLTIFSTHTPSSLLTSFLKFSTSFQQSSGLLSFSLKHFTTSLFAFSTPSSSAVNFFLCSSFFLNSLTSFCTASLPRSRSVSPADLLSFLVESSAAEILACSSSKSFDARSCRRLSSSATRAWMCNSRVFARVESVCGIDQTLPLQYRH